MMIMIEPLVVVIMVFGNKILTLDEIIDEFVEEAIKSNDIQMLSSSSYKSIKKRRCFLTLVFTCAILALIFITIS